MLPISDEFEFDYFGSRVVYGRGAVDRIGAVLAEFGLNRALVVCGSNVGANDDVMGPVKRGLGDRLAGVFDGTTNDKHVRCAYAGLEAFREADADVVVGVGGGSSVDVARMMTALAADGRTMADLEDEIEAAGEVRPLKLHRDLPKFIAVPTTFAGAGISRGGSLLVSAVDEPPVGELYRVGAMDPDLVPVAMVFDPGLFETTPQSALAPSAMNGFDKGIEKVYLPRPTPLTDATAVHGLRLLRDGLPRMQGDPTAMDRSVTGIVLAQFDREISIIHAFGHGFARRYPVQQGVFHGVVAPHVLRYLLSKVDARRQLLAEGLGIAWESMPDDAVAEAVVDEVTAVRDGLGLPARLRDIDPVDPDDFHDVAEFVLADHPMENTPPEFEPTVEEIESVIHKAW